MQRDFACLWADLKATGDHSAAFERLRSAYSEPRRHYHTLVHVHWGLRRLDEMERALRVAEPAVDWNALRWAMWFHDCFMFQGEQDEPLSAAAAREEAEAAGLPDVFQETVARLVRATAHVAETLPLDEALLHDADISILGAQALDFDDYEKLVRKEWSHVSDETFRAARADVLKRFQQRPSVFLSEYGRVKWEARAQANLKRSIKQLEAANGRS